MKGYARTIFGRDEVALLQRAERVVRALREGRRILRCHEVARAVGRVLGLEVQDGRYGMNAHSWCWVRKPRTVRAHSLGEAHILDPYAIGRIPQVQLVDAWYLLPEGRSYVPGEPRTDVRRGVVRRLVREAREALQ